MDGFLNFLLKPKLSGIIRICNCLEPKKEMAGNNMMKIKRRSVNRVVALKSSVWKPRDGKVKAQGISISLTGSTMN